MRLRPATPGDAPAVARILGDWVRETGWMPVLHTREVDQAFVRHLIASAEVTLAEKQGESIGFLAREGEELRALYVASRSRGRGVGRALLAGAKAERSRLVAWTFEANVRAQAFYRREGFVEAGRTDGARNEESLPDVLLTWESPQ